MRKFIHWLPVIVLLFGVGASRADVTLPKIIGDHMVLKRGKKAPIWGKAAPGEKVSRKQRRMPASSFRTDEPK